MSFYFVRYVSMFDHDLFLASRIILILLYAAILCLLIRLVYLRIPCCRYCSERFLPHLENPYRSPARCVECLEDGKEKCEDPARTSGGKA